MEGDINMANQNTIYVEIPGVQYGECIILDCYQGVWSLVSGRKVNKGEHAGKVFKQWCYPEKREGSEMVPGDKPLPWKLTLGKSKEESLQILKLIAVHLMPKEGK